MLSPGPSAGKRLFFRAVTLALLVVALWIATGLLLAARRGSEAPPGSLRYGLDRLTPLYPNMTASEIEQLLTETWSREYVYAPLVQHREGAIEGRWVNVDPAGFRRSASQGPWPPDAEAFNVFVYGGSTAYGYGVADGQTIPSFLQEELDAVGCGPRVAVYNFGRGNYYSEQERVLFEIHLTSGLLPDVAIFVDGFNEWKDAPKFTRRLEYLMSESPGQLTRRALKSLPLVDRLRLASGAPADAEDGRIADAPAADARADGERWLARWLRGKRLIAAAGREFGMSTYFVWQPVPLYDYRLELHPFAAEVEEDFAQPGYQALRHGYERLDRMRASHPDLEPAGDFLWLADAQRDRSEPLYVDAAHYTASFSRHVAARIGAFVAGGLDCAPDAGRD